MKQILHLRSSIQGRASYSGRLGAAIVEKAQAKYPGSTVTEMDLAAEEPPHLSPLILRSFFTPADQLTDADKASLRYSDEALRHLLAADIVVIGAPLYNFTIPSALKSWIDHITRAGKTFTYTDKGPQGLVLGKKVYIAMASGGVYSEGPMKAHDFVAPYLRSVLFFLGMTDVSVFRAEGVKVPGLQDGALERAVASVVID